MKTLERYAYIDTHSEAGKPERVTIKPEMVYKSNVWFNSYGNPTYMLYLVDGRTLLCVDDYGAMNGLNHIFRNEVNRKKDL